MAKIQNSDKLEVVNEVKVETNDENNPYND